MLVTVRLRRKCYLLNESLHSLAQALCLPVSFYSSSQRMARAAINTLSHFPSEGERTLFKSLARCFYFHEVNVSLSVLNMEGKLLLPLICDIAPVAIARIG